MDIKIKNALNDIDKKGYTILPGLISQENLSKIQQDILFIFDQALKNISDSNGLKLSSLYEKYLYLKEHHPVLKGKCYNLLGRLGSVQQAIAHSTIQSFFETLYNSPCIMDNFQVRIDDGSNDRILPLHQEMAQMSLLNLTIWIPLQDINTGGIGGLTFVPGSHKKGFVKHQLYKVPATYYGIKEDTYSKGELEYPTFKAGDAFIFHPLLMHGSVPNVSNNVRWTLVGRVNDITELNYIKNDAAELKYPTDRNEPVYKQYNRLIK